MFKQLIKSIISYYRIKSYYAKNNSILLVTHDMGLSGAPIVLLNFAKILKANNFNVVILSNKNGPLKEECKKNHIDCIIGYNFVGLKVFSDFLNRFEYIIVNTVVNLDIIKLLNGTNKKVIWWIHEGKTYLEQYKNEFPNSISNNIKIYCVGDYVKNILREYSVFRNSTINILNYGLKDGFINNKDNHNVIRISTIGSICDRKNQLLFLDVAKKMNNKFNCQIEFYIIGKSIDEKYYKQFLNELTNTNLNYIEELPHHDILNFINSNDIMVCTSKDDPMPVFITEALMCQNIVVCNENNGQYYYIVDNVNGFKYNLNDSDSLYKTLTHIVSNYYKLNHVKEEGRKIYLNKFTYDNFDMMINNTFKNNNKW